MKPDKMVPGGMYRVTYENKGGFRRLYGTFKEHIDTPQGKMLNLFTERGYRRVLWTDVSRIVVVHDSKRKVG